MLILERLEIGRFFQAIADPKNIRMGKPDPEIHLQVTEMLGISPDCCVGVEDTEEGIAAIKAAGMRSVGAGSVSMRDSAELWVPSTAELHVENLAQLFE
jgi:alpha,alpha-trehalose phosphorylase